MTLLCRCYRAIELLDGRTWRHFALGAASFQQDVLMEQCDGIFALVLSCVRIFGWKGGMALRSQCCSATKRY